MGRHKHTNKQINTNTAYNKYTRVAILLHVHFVINMMSPNQKKTIMSTTHKFSPIHSHKPKKENFCTKLENESPGVFFLTFGLNDIVIYSRKYVFIYMGITNQMISLRSL